MAETLLGLGDYRFSVETAAYQALQRVTDYRWNRQEVVGVNAALQYTGPGRDQLTIRGVVYPFFKGGFEQISDMRVEAGKGIPLNLVDENGYLHGFWVITQITEDQVHFAGAAPRKQAFTMTLEYYGDSA